MREPHEIIVNDVTLDKIIAKICEERAILPGANFINADGKYANLIGAQLEGADLSEANLKNADLRGAHLCGANLSFSNLEGADLEDADLTRANLTGAFFTNADVGDAVFIGATLTDTTLTKADLIGANLVGANLSGKNLIETNLLGSNLEGADLTNSNLTGADLSFSNLIGAKLRSANLTSSNLELADLSNTDLSYAILYNANLTDATLTGANLTGADLVGANLKGADLTGAELTFPNVKDAILDGAISPDLEFTINKLAEPIINEKKPPISKDQNESYVIKKDNINSQRSKSQFTPLTYVLIGIVITLLILYTGKKEKTLPQEDFSQKTRIAKMVILTECIPWIEISNADEGKSVCVIGKIIRTGAEYDELSGETFYDAYFSDNVLALNLFSTDRDFGQWKNECVIVRGTIFDTSDMKKYITGEYAPVIRLDEYSDRYNNHHLFNVQSVSSDLCQ
ncbi:MAG: hypothetical protein C0391_05400 [Anaerolinea sp.]|nr:hypothetical protein [Anaerolinea sp.]